MRNAIQSLYQAHRQVLLYLFFGGLTTLVNYIVYIACFLSLPVRSTTFPNLLAWIVAVLFAYATNRRWVFQSSASGFRARISEIFSFAGARVFTLVLETAILWLAVDCLRFPNLPVKLLAGIAVIVLNYFFSKFWIFKKDKQGQQK